MDDSPKPTESTENAEAEPFPEDSSGPRGDAAAGPPEGPAAVTEASPDNPPPEAPADSPQEAAAATEVPLPGPTEPPARDVARDASILESLLLVADHPLSFERIGVLMGGLSRDEVRRAADSLRAKHPPDSSGILVEEVAKGLQLRTNPANQEYILKYFDVKPQRFSRAALETLSVVAYKQPVTRLEMEQIRQVDCAAALRTLMEKRLVKVVGKKDVAGRPFLFGTTREFLEVFGLARLEDLPSLREIEEFLAARTGTPQPDPSAAAREAEPVTHAGSELSESLEATGSLGAGVPGSAPRTDVADDVLAEAAGAEGVDEIPGTDDGD